MPPAGRKPSLALNLPPPHRFASINYLPRTISFGYAFLVLGAFVAERGASSWMLTLGALQFLVYPHLAYLHARIAVDSKGAESRNLMFDALCLGVWAAQLDFALWPICGLLTAVSLNSASTGGLRRAALQLGLFMLGAAAWGAMTGFMFRPGTGPVVTGLSLFGIVGYTAWIGLILRAQNRRLTEVREALRKSQEQFQFIAEHAGDLVAAVELSGKPLYLSPAHAEYFGPECIAAGGEWLDFVAVDDRDRVRAAMHRMIATRTSEGLRFRVAHRDGTLRNLDCQGNPIVDRDYKVRTLIFVCRDLSAREDAVRAAAPPTAAQG